MNSVDLRDRMPTKDIQRYWMDRGRSDFKDKDKNNIKPELDNVVFKDGIEGCHEAVAASIEKEKQKYAKRTNPKHITTWYSLTKDISSRELAYIALQNANSCAMQIATRTNNIVKAAQDAEATAKHKALKSYAPDKMKDILFFRSKQNKPDWMFNNEIDYELKKHMAWTKWKNEELVKVGVWLMSVALEAKFKPEYPEDAQYIHIFVDGQEGMGIKKKLKEGSEHPHSHISYSHEFQIHLSRKKYNLSWRQPKFGLNPSEPKPWTVSAISGVKDGPFMYQPLNEVCDIVRNMTPLQQKAVDKALLDGTMGRILAGVNHLMRVPLQVDPYSLIFVEFCRNNKLEVSKIFLREECHDKELTDEEKADLKDYANEEEKAVKIAKYRDRFRELDAQRKKNLVIKSTTSTFERKINELFDKIDPYTKTENKFWQVMNLDTRSRVYPVTVPNFQDSDPFRACFRFYNGKPITSKGVKALKLFIANLYDAKVGKTKVSKLRHKERIAWTETNHDMIMAVGSDFETAYDTVDNVTNVPNYYWKDAGDVCQFVAACREYYDWFISDEKHDFLTTLAIQRDASCSGLQHYSGIALSYDDGAKVNLVPTEFPSDIYQDCADWVNRHIDWLLNIETPEDDRQMWQIHIAKQWKEFLVDRKTCKRPVMTWPYSGTLNGFRKQILDDIIKPALEKNPNLFPTPKWSPRNKSGSDAARWMAEWVMSAILEIVKDAGKGMRFIRSLTKALADEQHQLRYTTPLGFPLVQSYAKWETETYAADLYRRKINKRKQNNFTLQTKQKPEVDSDEAVNGAAPNLIHSLDATLLIKTVNACNAIGITDILVVHDSFATHACDIDQLAEVYRQQFVDLYRDYDFYQDLYGQNAYRLTEQKRAEILPIPKRGNLDLSKVASECIYALD